MIMITTLLNPVSIINRVSGSVSSVFGWVVAVTAVVFSAFVIYFGIYILYVPAKVHVKPVHFEFKLVFSEVIYKHLLSFFNFFLALNASQSEKECTVK